MEKPEETLKYNLQKIAKEKNYKDCKVTVKSISSEGANYTSFLYLATLQAAGKVDLRIFAKVAAVGEKMRDSFSFNFYKTESYFYNTLLNKYKQLENKNRIKVEDRFKTPMFFGGSDEYLKETVILEDLTSTGYTTHDRFKSIHWEYASKSLETLAKMHALSVALLEEDPKVIEEVSSLNGNLCTSGISNYLANVIKNAIEVTREENRDRLSKYTKDIMENKTFDKFYQHHRRPFIIHGDYRPSNMMHRIVEGKMEVVAVDYQTLRIGNPIIDIMYYIFNGSDKNFRDQYFKPSLEHYYEELCKALRRFGLNPEVVYPRDDFEFELKEILPVGLMLSMFGLLIVTVEKDEAPKINKDISFEDFAINPNTLYTERLNDIVDDYIKMGII